MYSKNIQQIAVNNVLSLTVHFIILDLHLHICLLYTTVLNYLDLFFSLYYVNTVYLGPLERPCQMASHSDQRL